MEFSKDMHLQVQLWTTQHRKFGQQNDDAQTASRFLESWSKAIRAKEALPPDSSLSTLEAVFVLENTCAVELCCGPCLCIMIFLGESPARTCSSLIYVLKSRSSEITH